MDRLTVARLGRAGIDSTLIACARRVARGRERVARVAASVHARVAVVTQALSTHSPVAKCDGGARHRC